MPQRAKTGLIHRWKMLLNLKIVRGIVLSLTKEKEKTICMPMRILVKDPKDVIEEARLIKAFGASITGEIRFSMKISENSPYFT